MKIAFSPPYVVNAPVDVVPLAKLGESLGFESIWFGEHPVMPTAVAEPEYVKGPTPWTGSVGMTDEVMKKYNLEPEEAAERRPWPGWHGSPAWPPQRTFVWAWFKLPQPVSGRKRSGSIRQEHRNPVALALDWQQCLDSNEFSSRADLARHLGITRAHVTQVLNLLNLAPDARSLILSLGDPIKGKGFGIHSLRSLLQLSVDEQISWIKERRPRA